MNAPVIARPRRPKAPRIGKADIALAKDLVKELGMEPAAVEVTPGRIRILSAQGNLTLAGEEASLDEELAKFRAQNEGRS